MAAQPITTSFIRKFFELDPADAAHNLEALGEDGALFILKKVPSPLAARAFDYLEPHFASQLLQKLEMTDAVDILGRMTMNRAAEVVLNLGEENRTVFLATLDADSASKIRMLVTFPEDTAGRMMSHDFLAFRSDLKVKESIRRLRSMARKKVPVSYVYVTDTANRLTGVLNMRDLLLADEDGEISAVMVQDIFTVNAKTDREEVARLAAHRKFLAIPVVDDEGRLLGTIKMDELVEAAQEEATEDIQKMFGAGGDEKVFSPLWFSVKKRLGWLHVNLATAFLAASVVSLFQDVIARVAILAVFLPIVAGQGGNAGAQSLAVVMRGLVLHEVEPRMAWKVIFKEGLLGMLNGIIIGLVTAAGAVLWHGNPWLGLVIGCAMVINMVAAGISGAAIPMFMKSIGWDPAQSSSIIQTTVTDVVGFFAFLGLATLFQGWLVK